MTGWRLDTWLSPKNSCANTKIQQNFFISANAFVQWRNRRNNWSPKRRWADAGNFQSKKKIYHYSLKSFGFGWLWASGCFLCIGQCKKVSQDSQAFAFDILEKAQVAVTPGVDFGNNAEGYLRFSYANSFQNIHEGMDRWTLPQKPIIFVYHLCPQPLYIYEIRAHFQNNWKAYRDTSIFNKECYVFSGWSNRGRHHQGKLEEHTLYTYNRQENFWFTVIGKNSQSSGLPSRGPLYYGRGALVKRVHPYCQGEKIGVIFFQVFHIIKPLINQ